MNYNQQHTMLTDEEIVNQMIKEGKTALFDENGNFLRWLTPEEKAQRRENFDEEYMCQKCVADWKRSMGIRPLWPKKDLPQQ